MFVNSGVSFFSGGDAPRYFRISSGRYNAANVLADCFSFQITDWRAPKAICSGNSAEDTKFGSLGMVRYLFFVTFLLMMKNN